MEYHVDYEMDRGKQTTQSVLDPTGKAVKLVRRKFATPPVKVACLECRASRTRCDGKPECANCSTKGKACVYTQSKRGGARIRKRKTSSENEAVLSNKDFNHCALSILPENNQESFAKPLSLVAPGGGLKQLDLSLDDTDFIFDSIFSARRDTADSGYDTSEHPGTASESDHLHSFVRVYNNDEDILGAYYTYIHPYFPVLPPPELHQVTDNPEIGYRSSVDAIYGSEKFPDFEPCTPLSLAISASLALIPHPDDPKPTSTESVLLRREQAQAFAQSAFESIEIESELPDSNNQPGEALSSGPIPINRAPFHPQNPLENESIIALLLLSTYEYAQRGNIAKMRNRAGQALNAALNLSLHAKGNEQGYFAEANRRVWWMTYIMVCQGSILSNSPPPVLLYDPRFTTQVPTLSADKETWTLFLEAQQVIVTATQFVIDLDVTLKTSSDTTSIWQRMLELEGIIEPLILKADTWTLESFPPVALDKSELKVSQALRGIARIKLNSARIKLHRYCAFADVPVFTKRHCDLKSSSDTPVASSTATSSPMPPDCNCSSSFHQLSSATHIPSPSPLPVNCGILPFSSTFSAKACLKSSFAIARSFSSLPFPQPIRASDPISYFPPMKNTNAPRMVPVFACCAMQSSYAMIMLSYKTRAMGFSGNGEAAVRLLGQLGEGLGMVLEALRNYSLAYEALGGQRDQIQSAADSVNIMHGGIIFEGQVPI
ncbi:hypothetical protein B0O99DRAFT_680155 [Bisporella sp. PMI_857]|nr:hypothetical protein B0O99DRAFT_680155 [Bisporella sp. PMI_857]